MEDKYEQQYNTIHVRATLAHMVGMPTIQGYQEQYYNHVSEICSKQIRFQF